MSHYRIRSLAKTPKAAHVKPQSRAGDPDHLTASPDQVGIDDGTLAGSRTPETQALTPLPDDLSTGQKVSAFLSRLMPAARGSDAASALLPWMCDTLPSHHSRLAYGRDLAAFVGHMQRQGIHPLDIRGDDVRLYKEAMQQAGHSAATIGRTLSVLRGTYEQFGKKGLVPWEHVGDIQAVKSPRVDKNTTPALGDQDASLLLHAPDTNTLIGLRDHAMLFTFFRTACRVSAITTAKVGDLERTDTAWYLIVTEKRKKRERKALLEAAEPILRFIHAAGTAEEPEAPLFPAIERDKETASRRHLTRDAVRKMIKKYGRAIGLSVDGHGRRGIGAHSLRKTTLTNSARNGAKMEQVQQLAGHSSITTTQLYFAVKDRDAEDAARHIQIR